LRVIRRKTWTKKGSRKKVSGRRRKGSFSVMGGIRLSDKKRVVDFIKKGTGDSFFSNYSKSAVTGRIHRLILR
jgi:hypothetical protein